MTAYYKGYHGDLNETYTVGQVDDASKKLIKAAHDVSPTSLQTRSQTYQKDAKILLLTPVAEVLAISRME